MLIRTHEPSIIGIIARFSDAVLLAGTLWLSVWLTEYSWSDAYSIAVLGGVLLYYFLAEINGVYASSPSSFLWEIKGIAWSWFGVVQVFLLATFMAKISVNYSRQAILTWFVLAPVTLILWRFLLQFLLKNKFFLGIPRRRVVIAGAGDLGKRLAEAIRRDSEFGLSLLGFYDDNKVDSLGNLEALIADAKIGKMDCVYIALPLRAEKRIKTLLSGLADTAVIVYMVPDFFVFELLHSSWQNLNGLPVISIYGSPLYGLGGVLKRLEDIVLSVLILIIITIPMLLIGLGVKLSSPGPILFKQRRYGLGGEKIWVWKFRTLKVCEDDESFKQVIGDDPRITKFGNFLRRTSLDELPQFINVLQGQMSIVGPRPHPILLNEQFRTKIPKYMLRHVVKPGITGWAQINGFRGETDTLEKMENRIAYDLYYIENWSLWFDIKIVFLTIFKGFYN